MSTRPRYLRTAHIAGGQLIDDIAVQRAIEGDRTVALTLPERDHAIRMLHARGLNDAQIGDRLGCSGDLVLRARREHGLPANPNPDYIDWTAFGRINPVPSRARRHRKPTAA